MTAPARLPDVKPGWFDEEDAPTRLDLNTCIHCGLCLTACPTYRELKIEPDSPRGRIYLMRGLAEGRLEPTDELVHHLDQCLDCRACETVCPAGVPYGRMLEQTRGQLNRRFLTGSPVRVLAEWTLRTILPDRDRMHFMIDLLRFGQSRPFDRILAWAARRGVLPRFVAQGMAMTPRLLPRRERALESAAQALPGGAWLEQRADALVYHPKDPARARVAFFTTCVMETMFPRVNQEAVRLLVLAGAEVTVPRAQSCCGALQAHAGLRRSARALARHAVHDFAGEYDTIVTVSAGCGAALREVGHVLEGDPSRPEAERFAARVRDVSEVLHELGLPPAPRTLSSWRDASRPVRIGYHDPCHLAHAQHVRRPPRELLRRLPGAEVVDLPNADWCCGSAGVYNLSHPEMANAQLERKLDSIEQVAPDVVVASNPGCLLHMARGVGERGLDTRLAHLVEVLGDAYPAGA